MADIKISEINTLVGPCLGKYTQQLVTALREDDEGYTAQAIPSGLAIAARARAASRGHAQPQADLCPERFAAQALIARGHTITPQDIEAESAAVQARLRWHLKK